MIFSIFPEVYSKIPVTSKYSVYDYQYGRCHLFALVLNETLNHDINLFINEDPFYEDIPEDVMVPPALEHAFCLIKEDITMDAGGISYIDSLFAEYCQNPESTITLTGDIAKNLINNWIKEGLLEDFELNEKEEIKQFIIGKFKNGY
jgi:hypothetical protein